MRPTTLSGITETVPTSLGNAYITLNFKDDQPWEVFVQVGKSGFTTQANAEGIARMCSLNLRRGISVKNIVKQLTAISTSRPGFSISEAIAQVLQRHSDA